MRRGAVKAPHTHQCRHVEPVKCWGSNLNNQASDQTFLPSVRIAATLLLPAPHPPVFQKLPYNVMAAIIIVGVSQLVELSTAVYLFKVRGVVAGCGGWFSEWAAGYTSLQCSRPANSLQKAAAAPAIQ